MPLVVGEALKKGTDGTQQLQGDTESTQRKKGVGTCELGLQHVAAGGQVSVVSVQLRDSLSQR